MNPDTDRHKRGTPMKTTPLIAASLATAGLLMTPAHAESPAEFYKGKTVAIMVPGSAGGSFGLYCRLLAAHWSDHIPGKPSVICEFKPGGGGTRGAAWLYNKGKKDGTDVGMILAPSILAPSLRGANYDSKKFVWLGSITPRPSVISVWHTSPAKTVEEAKKTAIKVGSTGFGSSSYLIPQFMNAAIGTKFEIIRGYRGGAPVNKAMEQGEVHGRMNYWTGWTTVKAAWLKEKKIVHLAKWGPAIPGLEKTPHLRTFLKNDDDKKMLKFLEMAENIGIGMFLAPGIPKDRVKALGDSLFATLKDPRFQAAAKAKRAPIEPLTGADIKKIADDAFEIDEPTLAKLRAYLKFKKR
jgi:tripartite-type tricarboxylate transporter receptor subunit TctC